MPLCRLLRPVSLCVLSAASLIAACGGGGGDPEGSGELPSATQQYPGGIWEGTVGMGASQRTAVGFIDPGEDGKGGEFFLARGAAGAAGYDALYGLLRTNLTAVVASNVTYFSVQDGKFAPGVALRGTAAPNPTTGKTAAITGSYTSPTGTAAATSTPTTFRLNYSKLNDYPASAALIEGTYRGTGVFGGNWVFTVSGRGVLSGRVGGCTVQGSIAPRSQDSSQYAVTMNLAGDAASCGDAQGTQQSGVAVLRFDEDNVPNGIWMFTRNATGQDNTYVLNGIADPRQSTTPSPTPLSATGNWAGTLTMPAGVAGDPDIYGTVLADGGFFFYTNSSFNHNVLYGRLIRYNDVTTNRFVTANDGVFFDRLAAGTGGTAGGYLNGVLVDATVESAGANGLGNRLTGTYAYSSQPGGYPTKFTMQPDSLYTLPAGRQATVNSIVGSYRMPGNSFGGHQVDIAIAADGSITGSTSNACLIVGKLLGGLGSDQNQYRVEAFGFLESPMTPANSIGCELSSGPSQSGSAAAIYDSQGNVSGLRILAAGLLQSGQRAHTVFVGSRRTAP
jgi:hypothetical protein